MEILTLCDKIQLQPEIKSHVIEFSNSFEFTKVDEHLKSFQKYERMSKALAELQTILGEDTDNIKILACMLKSSVDAYEIYKEKAISDEIYFDTMKCYTRFIDETYKMIGKLYFDRYWWITRQAGCYLFRIGELEYEMKHIDENIVIGIHIPSDVDFSPLAIDESLASAKQFFTTYYPELSKTEYRCHSWLLDKQIKGMLHDNSNILNFQNRFEIFDEGEIGTDFIEWLFNTKSTDYDTLSENTSFSCVPFLLEVSFGYFRHIFASFVNGLFFFIVLLFIYIICRLIFLGVGIKREKSTDSLKCFNLFNTFSVKNKCIFFITILIICLGLCYAICASSIKSNNTFYIYEDETTSQKYAVVYINDDNLVMEEVLISEDNSIHFYTAYQMAVSKNDIKLQRRTFKNKSIDYKTTENKNKYEVVTPYLFGIIQLPFEY